MPNTEAKAIILDDDEQYLSMLDTICQSEGFTTSAMTDAFEFLKGDYSKDDLLILDLSLPGIDGIEILRELSIKSCESRLIFVSGQDRGVLRAAEDLAKARSLNHVATLSKPIRISEFREYLSVQLSNRVTPIKKARSKSWKPTVEELAHAIENDQITAFFQPQVSMCNDELYGVEALARWIHPEKGLIPPLKFIPLAEKSGLIVPMTDKMVKNSIEQISGFQKQVGSKVNLSVNVSASHIHSYALPEVLFNPDSEHQIDPETFTLEVTESGLMKELVASLDILARLRLKGFNLSIDDFGTGYSSLYQLHKMPFNELKIDQTFVRSMLKDPDSLSIVETCIMLAKKLGMLTVAEGVEDAETYTLLKQLGCDFAQGYCIAKPMPIDELEAWSKEWPNRKCGAKKEVQRYA